MKVNLDKNFEFTNEINKKLDAVNSFSDLGSEIIELNKSLKKLSSELADTIDAGFENLLVQQEKNNSIPLLQMLQLELQSLSIKLDNSTAEITQSIVKDLTSKFEEVVQEFKRSLSDSAKAELENITAYLRQAGSTLADFPAKFQAMSDNLNKNFNNLQEMLQKTTKETLSQTNESTSIMKKQIQEMSDIVKYFYTIYS
jgi:Rad3-related DNA helicase